MLHQKIKDIYSLFSKCSIITYPFHRIRFGNSAGLRLHLGAGRKILEGFINIDSNIMRSGSMWYDITLKLPFPDRSADVIYCSNTLEHFYPDETYKILRECRRVLSEKGAARIVVPDLESSAKAYIEDNNTIFSDYPRKFESTGGKLANLLFCDGQHRYAFDHGLLSEIAAECGFSRCEKMEFDKSSLDSDVYDKIKPFEEEYKLNNLFCELFR